MKSADVRKKYIEFFVKRGHKEIPSAPLVPENDPTTLFTSSGMQPLVPYLLGQPHPEGTRLVNSQKSFRAADIDEVGDNRHTTFFEMLGNWSLGDYFKKEQLPWIWEFLTKELSLDPKRLFVSVFEGNDSVSKDTESIEIWKEIYSRAGIDAKVGKQIFTYNARKNWWSRAGEPEKMPAGEPGGPDSEVFFDFGEQLQLHEHSPWKNDICHPNCDCGRFLEIANSVFMQYKKEADGTLSELPKPNVDFGGGLERLTAATINDPDIFKTDLFTSIIRIIEVLSKKNYKDEPSITRAMRIVADHIKGAVMMMADGVIPSNKTQGYVLRRLIRRSLLHGRTLGLLGNWEYVGQLVVPVAEIYKDAYPEVVQKAAEIKLILQEEAMRFGKSLEKGLKEIEKIDQLDGTQAFKLYETFGFPWEMTEEIARTRGQTVEKGEFEKAFKEHRDKSRTAARGMFKGGLADHSEEVIKLHTATHLMHQALRSVLGNHVQQKGSNITAERLRFDFSHPTKLTPDEIKKVEDLVNQKIKEDLPVSFEITTYADAIKAGALAFFGERYPEKVKIYSIGSFSREICGGPHVAHTGVLGSFKLTKEEALGAGTRRIYAVVS
ncbi:MAG: Alanine-tRNA ligase [Candidatus Gottesmanbacteria bacterium GW2011_GWB1_43_11]|uniref:Alanine--tRNA ligase n=1 Tax=Candidatus Gottesmanbacteria bacterium GW2011_GWB1_43_11 TaxID=1618446 RepID=A0A0G1EV36_9BACT|nr:MAG: Alanine-tRNA ligase [Candidatus Gottesmanbacteria bacterium GW2011_GWA2_42_16]KKS55718.1 MAG: Alanine-tRNA ligase [Candidatus Gottesmanbacteria bacterium GW2011_GWA1_42_26]KKS86896.1 MAG: Alanine-tRNA ligase [Candidatus Gottesmanbacteria bacterium GW2011_GWB1_43_11]HCM37981.1 alanine--tRNA ligase [Patescibacteria group bacterium]